MRKSIHAEQLAEVLDPILQEHFEPGPEVKKFGQDDEEWWEQEGDSLSFFIQEILGQYLGFEDEIVDALVEHEDCWPPDGDIPFFDASQDYVEKPARPYEYYQNWNYVAEDLKHGHRFFSSAAASLFETIFADVENMKWRAPKAAVENVVWELPKHTELFRARICDSEGLVKCAYKEPLKHIGPPPPAQARAGRMNVEGVAVFYGATDSETCLAEIRPAIGNDTVIIKLHTTKPLRVLDFTRLEACYKELSYFQPDFTEQCERASFLRRLQSLISQPIIPGRETDYLITQTMAEYLAHVHDKPFAGILFKSVQRAGGTNIVLFPSSANTFPLEYVQKSFKLFSTRSIAYKHDEVGVGEFEGDIWIDHHNSDYDDE